MIRTLLTVAVLGIGTVAASSSAFAYAKEAWNKQQDILSAVRGDYRHSANPATMSYEGRAATQWDRPANTGIPRNESILGK